jgi:hypothetical protein
MITKDDIWNLANKIASSVTSLEQDCEAREIEIEALLNFFHSIRQSTVRDAYLQGNPGRSFEAALFTCWEMGYQIRLEQEMRAIKEET